MKPYGDINMSISHFKIISQNCNINHNLFSNFSKLELVLIMLEQYLYLEKTCLY